MSDLTEAFYARLYSFYRPTTDFSYNPKQPRDKSGKWTSAKGAGGPSKATAEPTTDKLWSGVSAHPERRVKPVAKISFPPEKKDDYESRKEANRRFASSVYETDLGNGYHSKVTQIEDHRTDGMTIRGVIVHKGREVGTFDRTFATERGGVSVDHTELMINPTHRSKGLADRFNAHAVAKYQEMGVDRITLHAGDEVGGFAWARQGFRFANYESKSRTVETALRAIEADIKYDPKLRADPAMKKSIEDEVFAVRKAMEEGKDVQPIHIASIGERHKWQSEHEISGPYTNWPGKRAMMRSSWEGVYYFDASQSVTAAAMSLEHAELRPQFKAVPARNPRKVIEEFFNRNQPRDKRGQWARSGSTVSHIRGEIQRERKAILKELDAQGVDAMNPLRHIFERPMGNRVVVVRDGDGKVVGGVQYNVDKQFREVSVRDMRMLEQRQGHGTAAFEAIAKVAVENDAKLSIFGAVESAKPFYMRLGAVFQTGLGSANFTTEARDALAAGKPIQGANLPYAEWIKIDF